MFLKQSQESSYPSSEKTQHETNFVPHFQNYERREDKMLRSIKKAHEMLLQEDPETAVTVHTIRQWCKEGKIKHLQAGNKILIDVECLKKYISMI